MFSLSSLCTNMSSPKEQAMNSKNKQKKQILKIKPKWSFQGRGSYKRALHGLVLVGPGRGTPHLVAEGGP